MAGGSDSYTWDQSVADGVVVQIASGGSLTYSLDVADAETDSFAEVLGFDILVLWTRSSAAATTIRGPRRGPWARRSPTWACPASPRPTRWSGRALMTTR